VYVIHYAKIVLHVYSIASSNIGIPFKYRCIMYSMLNVLHSLFVKTRVNQHLIDDFSHYFNSNYFSQVIKIPVSLLVL